MRVESLGGDPLRIAGYSRDSAKDGGLIEVEGGGLGKVCPCSLLENSLSQEDSWNLWGQVLLLPLCVRREDCMCLGGNGKRDLQPGWVGVGRC